MTSICLTAFHTSILVHLRVVIWGYPVLYCTTYQVGQQYNKVVKRHRQVSSISELENVDLINLDNGMMVAKGQDKCALEWKKWLVNGNWLTTRSMMLWKDTVQ